MKIYQWAGFMLGVLQTVHPAAAYPENIAYGTKSIIRAASPNDAATTITSIWTTTITSVLLQTIFGPNSKIEFTTIMTVTQIQPQGSLNSYPGTVLDTGITTM